MENGDSRKYICRFCGLDSLQENFIALHIQNEHSLDILDTEHDILTRSISHDKHNYIEICPGFDIGLEQMVKFICEDCSKAYPNKNSLRVHRNNYHDLKKCPDCDLKFTRRHLRMHRHEMHGMEIPTCGVCGYKSWVQAKVLTHQRKVHMKEKNVSCDQCDMKFFNNISLGRHKIAHGTDRKFECSYCHKKYPRLNTLRLHEKIHTKVKDKVCSICGQGFVQKASLNYHMKKHHPEAC